MKLTHSFSIERPPGEVFDAFLDIDSVATCMPGSRLLGEPEPGTYEGKIAVQVGPLGAAYSGRLTLLEVDRDASRLTIRAKGREQRGAGNADAYVRAELSADGAGTLVRIETDLSIRGKVAQFGRGVIGEVTDQIMQTFARNVEQMLAAGGPAPATAPPSTGEGLDAWSLVVRPTLQRHAVPILTVALSGLAAYVGARAAVRRRGRHSPTR